MSKVGGQSDIERVRDATDLVKLIGEHVVLKPRGREHVGLCPFHDDRTPSMAVVTHKGNAFYKCHACGAGGDAYDFVKTYHRMDFGEALRYLAQKAGITLTPWKRDDSEDSTGPRRMDVRKANAFATTFFRRTLGDETLGAAARQVIASRGIHPEMVEAFLIGAAPDAWDGLNARILKQGLPANTFASAGLLKPRKESDGYYDAFRNRVMFPICDELGNPIAFGARKIKAEDEPKYLNSAESAIFSKSKTLYGLHLAKRSIIEKQTAIITEGYTDVIACHQAGITNAVATLGTALTREHARILSKFCDTVVLLFDGDEAGMKAADRALEVFFSESVDIKICILPDGLDPDELLKQEHGRARFDDALAASIDALQYKIERFRGVLEHPGAASLSGRQKRLESFVQELAHMGFGSMQGVRKQMLLMRLAELMKLPVGTIEQALAGFAANIKPRPKADEPSESVDWQKEFDENEVQDIVEVSRARRLAEFDVLGLIVYEPAIALRIVEDLCESIGGVVGALADDRFQHPSAAAIARYIRTRNEADAAFTVQEMLSNLHDDEHRTVASRLYFDGQRIVGEDLGNLESAVRAALDALERCVCRERFVETVAGPNLEESDATSDPLSRLKAVVDRRREAGHIASAIGRGVRT